MKEKEEKKEKEEEQKIDTEELKKEASETVEKVKSTMKDFKIKDETKNATGFIKEMVKDPISKTSEITKDNNNKYFTTSIFIVIVWMILEFLYAALSYSKYSSFGRNILTIIEATVAPVFIVLSLTLIIFILNKKHKKTLTTILSTVVTVYLPVIVAEAIHLLYLINYKMGWITTPISKFATLVTIILSYFAIKDIFEEETELGNFKKFVLVEVIYFVVAILVSCLGISMYL